MALAGWKCAPMSVAWAVEAMLANSQQATTALGWLLRQIEAMAPGEEKEEAMAKVLDLSFAIAALARTEAKMNVVVPFPGVQEPDCSTANAISSSGAAVIPLYPERRDPAAPATEI